MMINIINAGAFYRVSGISFSEKTAIQKDNNFGKICNSLNMPIKIMGDLFNKGKDLSGQKEKSAAANDNFAVILKQGKRLVCGGHLKYFFTQLSPKGAKGMPGVYAGVFKIGVMYNRILYGDMIKFLLLLLILFAVLPRGIPVNKRNLNLNKRFTFKLGFIKKGSSFSV
jgi:hypothetical protein